MSAETQTVEVDLSTLSLSTESEFHDAPPILAQVMVDEFSKGDKGVQYHIAIKPLEYSIGGKTGWFHTYFNISNAKRSPMYLFVESWKQTFGKAEFGKGEQIGVVGWFSRKDMKFGRDKGSGDDIVKEGVILPVKKATPEEASRASGVAAVTPAAPAYTDAELATALDVVAGLDGIKAMKAVNKAVQAGTINSDLANALLNGNAQRVMVEKGIADLSGDGMVTRKSVVVAEAA